MKVVTEGETPRIEEEYLDRVGLGLVNEMRQREEI